MSISIYHLKPAFQRLLLPTARQLYRWGVTANQVTLFAGLVSVLIGIALYALQPDRIWFASIPAWFALRMALNALDGMLARDFGQKSLLGAYLNELTDVVSDAALYLPFARIAPFDAHWVAAIVLLAAVSELAGVVGQALGASRRYDGPMGKSDRACLFGVLGLAVACWPALPQAVEWVLPAVALLTAATVVNRVRAGVLEHHERSR